MFLWDSGGALLSSMLLGGLWAYPSVTGVPQGVLGLFLGVAVGLCLLSFTCYVVSPRVPRRWLLVVMLGNGSYALVTWSLLWWNRESVGALGWAYFVVETLVLVGVVALEWGVLQHGQSKVEIEEKP